MWHEVLCGTGCVAGRDEGSTELVSQGVVAAEQRVERVDAARVEVMRMFFGEADGAEALERALRHEQARSAREGLRHLGDVRGVAPGTPVFERSPTQFLESGDVDLRFRQEVLNRLEAGDRLPRTPGTDGI